MTTDDILRMARDAGALSDNSHPTTETRYMRAKADAMLRFAALVAAAEREQCAKVCDAEYYQHLGPEYGEVRYGISTCAVAIRARGKT